MGNKYKQFYCKSFNGEFHKMGTVIQPQVTKYMNTDACRRDDYIVLPKTTPLNEVIDRCFKENCFGFARGSNIQGNGKFYIRSPHKTTILLQSKLIDKPGVSYFILN